MNQLKQTKKTFISSCLHLVLAITPLPRLKHLNRTTIPQNISRSVRNQPKKNVTITNVLLVYRNINLFPIRPAQIMTDLRID